MDANGVDGDDGLLALVLAARDGDGDAFGRLYGRLLPLVRHVVADNVHDRAELDDVVQEVFTRAFQRLGALREPERFRPWLLSIARRAAIDHRRVRVAGRSVLDADPGALVADSAPGPDEAAMIREELRTLRAAAARLPRRDAVALDLVGHLGFAPAEVAGVLGITPGAAKVVVHRARQRLRNAMDDGTSAVEA